MADSFTLPIDETPNPAPLDLILSNEATITASISMTLEQSPRGLAEDRPPPLSAEPGPQIDYKLLQAVLSRTRGLLAPEDLEAISKLISIRKKYWMALSGYTQIHRQIQDIWVQRQRLVDQVESIKLAAARWLSTFAAQIQSPRFSGIRPEDVRNAYKAKVQALLRQNANSQLLNAKEARDAIGRYYIYAKGVMGLSSKFIEVKLETMPIIYKAQNVLLAFWGDELAAAAEVTSEPVYGNPAAHELPPVCQGGGTGNQSKREKRSYDMVDNESDGQQTIPEPKRHHGIEAASAPVYENGTAYELPPHCQGNGTGANTGTGTSSLSAGIQAVENESSSVVGNTRTSTKASGNQSNCKKRGCDMVDNENDGPQTMPEQKRHHGIEEDESWWGELKPLGEPLEADYW
ncbi:hypothetical protein DTO207G8_4257 [Paecilomyces variotii]|nr:hypothetical protein DTO207G8_4257 [Paecilomyces variotii]